MLVSLEIAADFCGFLCLKYVLNTVVLLGFTRTSQAKHDHKHHHQPPGELLALPPVKTRGNVLSDSVATERAHASVYTYTTTYMLVHEHTLALSLSCPPGHRKGPLHRGASLGRCAECSGSRLVFWFPRPLFKMTEILRGLGKLPRASLTDCFGKNMRRTLNGCFPVCQSC